MMTEKKINQVLHELNCNSINNELDATITLY